MKLQLNGTDVILNTETSFKITRENPFFSNKGDYTLDVTLPLAGCAVNQTVFGAIHRPEASLNELVGVALPFWLFAPPINLHGQAVVTEVTHNDVKVQLIGGKSLLFGETAESIYVDELDLGMVYDEELPSIYDQTPRGGETYMTLIAQELGDKAIATREDYREDALKLLYGRYPYTPCVMFPVECDYENNKIVINDQTSVYWNASFESQSFVLPNQYRGSVPPTIDWEHNRFAAHPYLLHVVDRVFRALGMTLSDISSIADSWMKDVFIINTNTVPEIKHCLPHWTVAEFIEQIQNFYGVVVDVDAQLRVNLVKRGSCYGGTNIVISQLCDIDEETSSSFDEEGNQDSTATANVDYDYPEISKMLRLPDEVYDKAVIVHGRNYNEIVSHFNSLGNEKEKSMYLYENDANGCKYAILYNQNTASYVLHEVDQMAPLIRNASSRDIGVSLKLVPCGMATHLTYPLTIITIVGGTEYRTTVSASSRPMPVLHSASKLNQVEPAYSVNEAINPSSTDEDDNLTGSQAKNDYIEIALRSGGRATLAANHNVNIASGIPYYKEEESGLFVAIDDNNYIQGDDFDLLKLTSEDGMKGSSLEQDVNIDSRCLRTFVFYDSVPMDIRHVFVIRGKRYACQKIEYTVDTNGVQPAKRGYFYELL